MRSLTHSNETGRAFAKFQNLQRQRSIAARELGELTFHRALHQDGVETRRNAQEVVYRLQESPQGCSSQ